ncbi:MAG: hypothetical protein HDS72_10650 [Bacteroidales bacterium]|nr:hypothetical protein [Bacteroidales bacterium]
MAKKQVSYGDYEVIVEDGGKIVVMQSGQVLPNAKAGLRAIAEAVGFDFDPKWTTQQGGSKLVKFLASAPAAAAPAESKPQPSPAEPKAGKAQPAAAPKAVPVAKNNNKPKDEELTPEEMKQLDEILKRLEALEARLAKLEKAPAAATPAAARKREVIIDAKTTTDRNYDDHYYYKTSEGRVLKRRTAVYMWYPDYITVATQVLIACGEEGAVDFSGFTSEPLDVARKNNTEQYQKLMKQLITLATKYGAKGDLPALLPDDSLLFNNGHFYMTEVSKKDIKF